MTAAAGGLIFRLDDDEGGYTVTLTPGASDVVLAKSFETVRPEAKPIDPKAVPDRRAENDTRNGRDS